MLAATISVISKAPRMANGITHNPDLATTYWQAMPFPIEESLLLSPKTFYLNGSDGADGQIEPLAEEAGVANMPINPASESHPHSLHGADCDGLKTAQQAGAAEKKFSRHPMEVKEDLTPRTFQDMHLSQILHHWLCPLGEKSQGIGQS